MASDKSTAEQAVRVAADLRVLVSALEPASLSGEQATDLVDRFATIERLAVAGKAVAAARAAEAEAWRAAGDRSAADWLAKRTASTVGDARSVLDTGARLGDAPQTDAAFRAGELSLKQAEAIIGAVHADPSAESALLAKAKHESLQKLRDETARVRAAAEPDPAARHERIRRGRFWRRWTDPEGARCGAYRLTPEAAAIIEAAAQPFIDAAFDAARHDGRREPAEAYAADGLVAMAQSTLASDDDDHGRCDDPNSGDGDDGGPDTPRPPRGGRGRRRLRNRRELIGLVDLRALRRGAVEPGETCEIAGVGPVPVSAARDVFGDALLRIVVRDGVDIRTVVHTGRTANAVQETAVLVRDDGRCIRPRCDLPISEIDHLEGFALTRTTTLDDLGGLCDHDHDLKSRFGHTYRRDADGRVQWTRPDGTVEYERPPP